MTQSGQGNEPQLPAVPPAQPTQPVREGVVLPAQGDQRAHDQHQAAPAGGQAWGQPWGPQGAPQAEPQALGQPGAPVQPQPLPQPQGDAAAPAQQGWPQNGEQNVPQHAPQSVPQNAPQHGFQGGAPLSPPPAGAPQNGLPAGPAAPHGAPYGRPQGAPMPAQGQPYAQQGWPPAQGQQPQPQGQPPMPQGQPPMPPQPQGGPPASDRQAQPFAGGAGPAAETQMLPPQPGFPGPPAADSEATQYIPPVAGQAPGAMPLPPEGAAPTAPPAHAAPGPDPAQAPAGQAPASTPLPPENRSGHPQTQPESDKESTTVLRAVRPGRARHGAPQAAPGQPAPGAAEETQVLPGPIPAAGPPPRQQGHGAPQPGGPAPYAIRPGMPGDRQPPSEFDGLFRADGEPAAGADSTQQLPQFSDQGPMPGPPAPEGDGPGRRGGGRRRMSPAVLIGIVVGVCAIAGLAAGAALSAGGDDDKKDTKAEESQTPDPKVDNKTKAADPAEAQAKALDALLADSNNSRAAVIKAVEDIKTCKNLSTAATNLRTAAGQRTDLVTRLGKISVDKLPKNAQLTSSLTKAWQSSATADNQYAAWADQVGGKKGCHKGQARATPKKRAGDLASTNASKAKGEAVVLWNEIAAQYGLQKRQAAQL